MLRPNYTSDYVDLGVTRAHTQWIGQKVMVVFTLNRNQLTPTHCVTCHHFSWLHQLEHTGVVEADVPILTQLVGFYAEEISSGNKMGPPQLAVTSATYTKWLLETAYPLCEIEAEKKRSFADDKLSKEVNPLFSFWFRLPKLFGTCVEVRLTKWIPKFFKEQAMGMLSRKQHLGFMGDSSIDGADIDMPAEWPTGDAFAALKTKVENSNSF